MAHIMPKAFTLKHQHACMVLPFWNSKHDSKTQHLPQGPDKMPRNVYQGKTFGQESIHRLRPWGCICFIASRWHLSCPQKRIREWAISLNLLRVTLWTSKLLYMAIKHALAASLSTYRKVLTPGHSAVHTSRPSQAAINSSVPIPFTDLVCNHEAEPLHQKPSSLW